LAVNRFLILANLIVAGHIVAQSNTCMEYYQVYGTESVSLADRSNIQGRIYSAKIEVGNDSYLEGVIVAPSQLTLRDRVSFQGELHWQNQYQAGNQNKIQGTVSHDALVDSCSAPTLPSTMSGVRVEIPNGVDTTLEPGTYGDLVLRTRSILSLIAGVYHFNRFEIEPDTRVEWDLDGSDLLTLQVNQNVRIGDRAMMEGSSTIQIIAGGDIDIGTDTWTRMDLSSVQGNIRIASRAQLGGRLYARNIRLEPDVGAFGVPALRADPMFDQVLLQHDDLRTLDDFQQIALRTSNPESGSCSSPVYDLW